MELGMFAYQEYPYIAERLKNLVMLSNKEAEIQIEVQGQSRPRVMAK